MISSLFLWSVIGSAVAGFGLIMLLMQKINQQTVDNEKALQIADAIKVGAMTFLKEEYRLISIVVLPVITLNVILLASAGLSAGAIEISSVEQFNKLYSSDKPMIAMYTATWCGPCKATKPHFKALANEITDVTCAIIDTDCRALKSLTSGIRGIPTFIMSHKGKAIDRTSGGRSKTQLKTLIANLKTKIK